MVYTLYHRSRLLSYFRVLAEDGTVTFKTDNTGLFEWSLLEIMAADLKVIDITRDLHAEAMSIGDPEAREAFNIETVGWKSGFSSRSQFWRSFKKETGICLQVK